MHELNLLRNQLTTALTLRFGDPRPMEQLAKQVQTKFGDGRPPSSHAITSALAAFIRSGSLNDFRSLKLICYGAALPPKPGQPCVLEDESLLTKLLAAVSTLKGRTRQLRRCFQGLLSTFFSYAPPTSAQHGWHRLRAFLAQHLRHVREGDRVPDWVEALHDHEDLLSEAPCVQFGRAFLKGETATFNAMCERLHISQSSWVREQVVLAAVKEAIRSSEAQFRRYLDTLLPALAEIPSVQLRGVRNLLDHYADLSSTQEHAGLRTAALELMGNPLLIANGQRWREVSAPAREMVGTWLKHQVISLFFNLLSQDGNTDRRRVEFWSDYAEQIENIWVVFGETARARRNMDFANLRKLLGDNALILSGAAKTNNAFIMKIGSQYVIEFGETGNAAYVYPQNALPFELSGTLHLRDDLKHGSHRLPHQGLWQYSFRRELRLRGSGITPAPSADRAVARGFDEQSTAFERELRRFCADTGLVLEDRRGRENRWLVHADNLNTHIANTLAQWNFRYDQANSWWEKRTT